MKVSTSWLNSYLPHKLSAAKLAETLEKSGLEVESIQDARALDSKIVVAKVLQTKAHPNADKLKLVEITTGKTSQWVVCGAPNVSAGMMTAWAKVGALLPDGTKIEEAEIRGQASAGMLCSDRELGWSDEHEGIVELDEGLKPGQSLAEALPAETVIDLTAPANRWDLLSVVGLAREVAAHQDVELKLEQPAELEATEKSAATVTEPKLVPRYMLAELEIPAGDKPTPRWLRQRLEAAGVRSVNAVVDITNYCMLEWGQPLHAFDADAFEGPISVRKARGDERVTTLDSVERQLSAKDLVITAGDEVLGLAGVMGAKSCEVHRGTNRIYLEAAVFEAATIRQTAKRHGLRTEASARFERGLPVQLTPIGLARAVELLQEVLDAKPLGAAVDLLQIWPWIQHVGLRSSRVQKLSKLDLSRHSVADYLQRLGFEAEPFNIVEEAKKHLGKPYKWGASFKQDGTSAFDCSYLIDYIYSLIGIKTGHTAAAQSKAGWGVNIAELAPGDVLYRGGPWEKLDKAERHGVSHTVLYLGEGRVIHAADRQRDAKGKWGLRETAAVIEEPVQAVTEDPEFMGVRRYASNLEDYVAVTVPWWRGDVKGEEDLIEEAVKLVGYDQIEATLPVWRPAEAQFDRYWPRVWELKSYWRSLGWFEVNTYSFVSQKLLEAVGYEAGDHLKLKNPLSSEQAYLRSDLLPSLLQVVQENRRYGDQFGLFEVSKTFIKKPEPGELPEEPERLAAAVMGEPDEAYREVKRGLDLIARQLGLSLTLKPAQLSWMHPYKQAEVWSGQHQLGYIGELHPQIVADFDIASAVGYIELDLLGVLATSQLKKARPVSRFPGIVRDLSIKVKEGVTWQEVAAVAAKAGAGEVEFRGDYFGPGVEAGHKAVTIRLQVSAADKTLTDAEADQAAAKLMAALAAQLGAKAR